MRNMWYTPEAAIRDPVRQPVQARPLCGTQLDIRIALRIQLFTRFPAWYIIIFSSKESDGKRKVPAGIPGVSRFVKLQIIRFDQETAG